MFNRTIGNLALKGSSVLKQIAFESELEKLPSDSPTTFSADDAYAQFKDANEMLGFLDAREDNAFWDSADTNSLTLLLLEESLYARRAAPEIVKDTANNTGLLMCGNYSINSAEVPLRNCSLSSLQDRVQISGSALKKVSRKVYQGILNDCAQVAKGTAKIRNADNKVSAVLSEEYVILPMPEIFQTAAGYICDRFRNNKFVGGSWTHVITSATWELGAENSLIRTYKEALERHGVESNQLQPGLRLSSSDIGASAVNLMPKLVVGKSSLLLPLGKAIALEHKGESNMQKFHENLGMVFSQYVDRLENLAALLKVEIENPVNCLGAIMKRLSIPKKYGMQVIDDFSIRIGSGYSNAHDLYYELGKLLFVLQIEGVTGEKALRMEESIARALSLNFKDYDYPGELKW